MPGDDRTSSLRDRAELILDNRQSWDELNPDDVRATVHELKVHQVELELQNEELRIAQIELENARTRYAKLFNSAPVGYLVLNRSGQIVQANDTFLGMIKPGQNDLLTRPLVDLVAEEDKTYFLSRYRTFFKQPQGKNIELRMVRSDHSEFIARLEGRLDEWRIVPRRTETEPILFTVVTDVTQRNKEEDILKAAKEEAEAANLAKSNFLAAISHEIRTPMNAILGFTTLALEDETDSQQREYWEIVSSSARHLMDLLQEILDLSKIEKQLIEIERQEFDFQLTIDEAISSLAAGAADKGIALRLTLDPDLPRYVIGDGRRLYQVLHNLVGNAIKFTHEGRVAVTVDQLRGDVETIDVVFIIEDTGIGIPTDKQKEVFEPFTQVDFTTTRQYGGVGLGLSICRKLVEAMGGQIRLRSTEGQGSSFTIQLQFGLPAEPEMRDTGAETNPVRAQARFEGPGPVVLIVEDNPVNTKLAAMLLEKIGCRTLTAASGPEAVVIYQSEPVDIVLMDIEMPGMNGIEAAAALRSTAKDDERRVPIVAMTAHAMKGDRERFLESGLDDYLTKPIDREALFEIINRRWDQPGRMINLT